MPEPATREEREAEVRALGKFAQRAYPWVETLTDALIEHYVASDMTIAEIKWELTNLTARADERIGEIDTGRRRRE